MPAQTKPTPPKSTLKGCISILMIIAGITGLVYCLPAIYKAGRALNPTDRQTIILAAVIITATTRRK